MHEYYVLYDQLFHSQWQSHKEFSLLIGTAFHCLDSITNIFSSVSIALIAMMLAEDLGLSNLRSIAVADIDAAHCTKSSQGCSSAADQSIYQSHVPNEGTNSAKCLYLLIYWIIQLSPTYIMFMRTECFPSSFSFIVICITVNSEHCIFQ
jgi:hypothetical protein